MYCLIVQSPPTWKDINQLYLLNSCYSFISPVTYPFFHINQQTYVLLMLFLYNMKSLTIEGHRTLVSYLDYQYILLIGLFDYTQ